MWQTLVAGILAIGTVAACSSAGNPSTGPSVEEPAPHPSGSVDGVTPTSDAVPGYIDIVDLTARPSGESIAVSMSVSAAVPTGTPNVGQLRYQFLLDLDGDGEADRIGALEAVPGGGFVPVLEDRRTGARIEAGQFPGTAELSGNVITLTIALQAIGCPPVVGVQGTAQQTLGGSTAVDRFPEVEQAWITVKTDCPSR